MQALPFPFLCPHIVCGDYIRLLFVTAKMSDYVIPGIICITEPIYEHGIIERFLQNFTKSANRNIYQIVHSHPAHSNCLTFELKY